MPRGFARSVLTAGAAAGPAANAFTADANTKLLLHFDGTNGGTTITDDSGTGKTVTASGGANTDTAIKLYGSASGEMITDDDIFTVSSHADFNFSTGDFTIEAYVYSSDWGTSSDDKVIWEGRNGANGGNGILVNDASGGGLGWYVYKNAVILSTGGGYMTNNTWQHVAWVRNSGVSKIYIDGVERASATDTNSHNFNVNCIIGSDYVSSGSRDFNGYIDELRVSNIARYTTTFTPGA